MAVFQTIPSASSLPNEFTPSTYPDYMSIKSQTIDKSPALEANMLRKHDFFNMIAN